MRHPWCLALIPWLAAAPASAEWRQIGDPAAFTAEIVNNVYFDETGAWFRFNPDGTLSGVVGDQSLSGQWTFDLGLACYSRVLGDQVLSSDCSVILVDGDQMVTVRDQGKGRQSVYLRQ